LERDYLEQALDQPLGKRDLWDVTLMFADITGEDQTTVLEEVERLLTDREAVEVIQRQQVTTLETYIEADRCPPRPVITGELRQQVQSENWGPAVGPTASGGASPSSGTGS